MLKKELAALKAQLVSQEKMLSKQAAEAGEGDAYFKNYVRLTQRLIYY